MSALLRTTVLTTASLALLPLATGCGALVLLFGPVDEPIDGGANSTRDGGRSDAGGFDGGPIDDGGVDDAGTNGCTVSDVPTPPPPAAPCATTGCTLFRVGFSEFGCPTASSDACDYHVQSQADPLGEALAAAVAGDYIWLYPGAVAQTYDASSWFVDKAITIEGAPSVGPDEVVLRQIGATPLGIVRLASDGVTLRNLTIRGTRNFQIAVNANLSNTQWSYSAGFSTGHTLDRLIIDGTAGYALQNINSVSEALSLGSNTVVRNCDIRGWWEEALFLWDEAPGTIDSVSFVHNTVVLVEGHPAVVVGNATSVIVRNNILVSLNPGEPAVATASLRAGGTLGTSGAVVQGNLIYGHNAATGPGIASSATNIVADPGFVRWDRPAVSTSSIATCGGVDAFDAAGELDLRGEVRGGTIGAVQLPSMTAPLGDVVQIGPQTADCPGGCDFTSDTALATAVGAAAPGSTITLHEGMSPPFVSVAEPLVVNRPLTIEGAASQLAGTVELTHVAPINVGSGLISVAFADNVTLRNFTLRCHASCQRAVYFDRGSGSPSRVWQARDGLIDRVVAISDDPFDVEEAFALGHSGEVRNSLAIGEFEAFARVRVTDAKVVGNTLYSTESGTPATALYLGNSANVVVANNLFALTGSGSPRVPLRTVRGGEALPVSNPTISHNHFYGISQLDLDSVAPPLPSGPDPQVGNCIAGLVGLDPADLCALEDAEFVSVAATDFRPAASSGEVDQGDDDYVVAGELDLAARPRVVGVSVDVGALERAADDP